jgi:hypothetical protein
MKLREFKKKIKGVFKQPVRKYYIGKKKHGTPYYWPRNHVAWGLTFRKLKVKENREYKEKPIFKYSNFPKYARNKYKIVKLFGNHFYVGYGWPIKIVRTELGWKDKWGSARFEWNPAVHIFFFCWQFRILWTAPFGDKYDDDDYWEQALWFIEYSDCNIEKARETWPWRKYDSEESTWNDDFLI